MTSKCWRVANMGSCFVGVGHEVDWESGHCTGPIVLWVIGIVKIISRVFMECNNSLPNVLWLL